MTNNKTQATFHPHNTRQEAQEAAEQDEQEATDE